MYILKFILCIVYVQRQEIQHNLDNETRIGLLNYKTHLMKIYNQNEFAYNLSDHFGFK
jgi:hypothetical protein